MVSSEKAGGGNAALISVVAIVSQADIGGGVRRLLGTIDVRLIKARYSLFLDATTCKRAWVQRLGNRLGTSVSFGGGRPGVPLRQVMRVLIAAD